MHCEIGGWGMQEYNNTASYPDSARAARIQVHDILWRCSYILKPLKNVSLILGFKNLRILTKEM